jgi:hypothetical protein
MNKEKSLSFLQSCIDKVNVATAQDIQFYREIYNKDCTMPIESSDFEFVFPTEDFAYKYEINSVFELKSNDHDMRKSIEQKIEYNFLGVSLNIQQDNDNLPYAA